MCTMVNQKLTALAVKVMILSSPSSNMVTLFKCCSVNWLLTHA